MTIVFVTNMKKVYSSGNLGLVPRITDSVAVDDRNCTERIWHVAESAVSNALGTYGQNTVELPPDDKRYCNINQSISTENYLQVKNKAFAETVDVISHVADFVKAMKDNITERIDAECCGTSFCTVEERPSSTHDSGAEVLRSSACGDDVKSLSGINTLAIDDEPHAADEFEDSEMSEINDSVASYSLHSSRHPSQEEEIGCGERGKLASACKVCGDHATGMYFGALVCVPCKTFFLRYAGEGHSFVCKGSGDCQISTSTRTQCKFCRYQKCLQAGMHRRVRPAQVKLNEGQQLCVVCSDVGNGVHFGALTCEGCKKFFRRGLTENGSYTCKSNNNCVINPQTRNSCRYCRYQKCIKAGMCREAIQMGRPSKLPSSTNVSRSTIDRHHLQLRPSNRILDGSNTEALQSAIERSHAENLSQVLGLQHQPENWINDTFFGHSYANNPKTSQSPNLSEEEPIDVENSEDLYCGKCTSTHPTSSCSDVTQQPDSTVLSPMEMGHADEPDEPFFVDSASCPRNSSKAKGQFLSRNGIRGSTGDAAVLKDKQRRLSSGEAEGCSGRMPDRLPMRLHNGGKHSSGSCTDTVATGKRQKSNVALLSQEMLASTMLPLLKENGSYGKNFERRLRTHTSVDCSTSEQASGGCSSPSITSSFPSEMFQKDPNRDDEGVNSAVNEALENEDSVQGGAVPKRFDIESLVALSRTYWLQPCLPDPNILFAGAKHWDVLNSIVPAYDRFLQMSNTINRTLKAEFEEWSRQVTDPMDNQTYLSDWIKQKVIPAYTIASVTYCKSLPGFSSFHCDDQITIIRLGQSPSRILMAALNWYDADQKNFRNFLSWRDKKPGRLDLFKQKLIEYAEDISSLEVDAIEAALLNVLLILATDYPDLVRADIISDARWKILSTFRAYTTGKCGTPNNRVESLFSHIPELRRLGLLHHMMMTTRTMTAEEVEYLTSGRILDSQMVLSCQQSTGS